MAKFYRRGPEQVSEVEVQRYLLHLIQERKLARSSCNIAVNALKFCYQVRLKHPQAQFEIPRPRQPQKLPQILALLTNGRLKLAGSTAALAKPGAQRRFLATLRAHDWMVYAKLTVAGPQAVLDDLGRYTTKTALSNSRLLSLDVQGNVRFSWRDGTHGNRRRIMQLPAAQFLDRFLLHALPPGLVRIRHIGLLANRHKRQQLAHARTARAAPAPAPTPVPKESVQRGASILCGA